MKTILILIIVVVILYFTGKKFIKIFTGKDGGCEGCSHSGSCDIEKK